jgi:hypothetical protein
LFVNVETKRSISPVNEYSPSSLVTGRYALNVLAARLQSRTAET